MNDFDRFYILGVFLPSGLFALLWTVGLILAVAFWRRHPGVSSLMALGSLLLLLNSTVGTYIGYWIQRQALLNQWAIRDIDRAMIYVSWARSAVNAVASVLLIWAAFGWRRTALFTPVLDDDEWRGYAD